MTAPPHDRSDTHPNPPAPAGQAETASNETQAPQAPGIAKRPPRACPNLLGRSLLYALALTFLFLGILGIFIPGLPTTVFILLSAWAAARSSPRLHRWLREHRVFGPMLRNWEEGGYVSRKAKRSAVLVMLVSVLIMLLAGVPTWVLLLASACMACVAVWLWRRPEPPPDQQLNGD